MTESTMTEDLDREDRAVLTALARLIASGTGVPVPRAATEADEGLVREYLEALGLLPYGLEPEAPSPAVKERILARVEAEAATAPPQRSFEEVTFAGAAGAPVDVTLQREAGPPEPASTDSTTSQPPASQEPDWPEPVTASAPPGTIPFPNQEQPAAPRRGGGLWTGLMAAALMVCIAGLGYLTGKVQEQNRTIARLSTELAGIPVGDLTSLNNQLQAVQSRMDMVTTIARSAYHLDGVEHVGNQPVDGIVYVCGKHQRWYLNVQGLEQPPAGQEYRLWFVTGDGMVSGGVVQVDDGAKAEKEDQSMPDGTHGFAITLEDVGSDPESPSGMMVLLGEESVSL